MPHALSSSGRRAHLPDTHTCTHCLPHHHVCVWALGCHGFISRQLAGFCLPRGMGRGGVGESDVGAPTSAPLPSRSCTPPSLPPPQCQLPGLPRAKGLGPAKDGTWGCIPALNSATPTCNKDVTGLAPTRGRPEPGSGEEQPGPASISPTCAKTPPRGQQCGDSCRHLERGWRSWFSGGQLWGSTLWPLGELWVWLLSPLPSPGSWHCPCPWSACWAGCCGRQRGPVFNCLSFQTSATAGPSQ